MMKIRIACSIALFAGLVLGQGQSLFQQHEYTIDWEDWPSFFIDEPIVAVCYHAQATSFESCVNFCAGEAGKTPVPADPDCDMIVTAPNFEELPRFDWTAFANHTTAGQTYQFIFVLQSDDRSQREVFKTGDFVMRGANTPGVPTDSPTEFLVEAEAVDVPQPVTVNDPGPATTSVGPGTDQSTSVPSGEVTSEPSPAAQDEGGSSTPAGVIIGGVLGGVAGGAIVTLAAVLLFRRKRQSSARASMERDSSSRGGHHHHGDVEAAAAAGRAGATNSNFMPPPSSVAASDEKKADVGSVSEVEATRPVAELEAGQVPELATQRMSQIGVSRSELGDESATLNSSSNYYMAQSPTLGHPQSDVSPLEETLHGRRI